MTALDLTPLAADCEARAKAGEKPNPEIWNKRVAVVPRSGESDLGVFVWLPLEAESIFSEHDWQDDDPASQLFAEALLREATAPLHASTKAFFDSMNENGAMGDLIARACGQPEEARLIGEYEEMVEAHAARVKALEDQLAKAATRIRNMRRGLRENAKAFTLRNIEASERLKRVVDLATDNKRHRELIREQSARIAALEAALAEAKDVACKWRDHHAEKPDRATYWNDLAARWQDALAGQAGGDK